MLDVTIDSQKVEQLMVEKIEEAINAYDEEMVFWDTAELKRRTCMSWSSIQDNFFFDDRFPKAKIGGKWYYPAKETEQFLLMWLSEQRVGPS